MHFSSTQHSPINYDSTLVSPAVGVSPLNHDKAIVEAYSDQEESQSEVISN